MKFNRSVITRTLLLVTLTVGLVGLSSRMQADTGACGGATITLPFTDVPTTNIFFCSIASAYFTGLTNGTTATTYNPSDPVLRDQMAAFVTRTLDQSVKRGNPRAALGEWWVNRETNIRTSTDLAGHNPRFLACDGLTVWASLTESDLVTRFDLRTGVRICRILGIPSPEQIVIVGGTIFVASAQAPGKIYPIEKRFTSDQVAGTFIQISTVGDNPVGMTYDGLSLWTANDGNGPGTGSVSRVSFPNSYPGIVTTFTAGFSQPRGILFDGVNLWVADAGDASLKRVDRSSGAVLQTIVLSGSVQHPVFDGTNLWIPSAATPGGAPNQVFVVRAVGGLTGTVLAVLTGNGLNAPFQAAFDGERICVTNANTSTVSLWRATDLLPLTSFSVYFSNFNTRGICSDGTTFYIGLRDSSGTQDVCTRF